MDEPTTALDVVVQREILQELEELKRRLGFAVLFITHDLSLLVEFSDRIAIMYAGEIVEIARPRTCSSTDPLHPYTSGLMNSFPPLTGPIVPLTGIPGAPPDLAQPPPGCRFHPRCPQCTGVDSEPASRCRPACGPCCARSSPATTSPATGSEGAMSTLEVQQPRQALPGARHGPAARDARRRRRRLVHAAPGLRDGARRRERQRQEHGRAPARAALRADRRQDPLRGPGRRPSSGGAGRCSRTARRCR